jgi:hypothetical protein
MLTLNWCADWWATAAKLNNHETNHTYPLPGCFGKRRSPIPLTLTTQKRERSRFTGWAHKRVVFESVNVLRLMGCQYLQSSIRGFPAGETQGGALP